MAGERREPGTPEVTITGLTERTTRAGTPRRA